MAGKSRQPSHEPPRQRRKNRHLAGRKGGTGKGGQPARSPHAQKNANAQKTLPKMPTKPLQRPMD